MSKDGVSVPLNNLASSNSSQREMKFNQKEKQCTNSLKFKLIFLVLICLLIVLLITALTIVILKSYGKPCSSPISTTPPKVRVPPTIRKPNKFWNEYYLPPSVTVTHYNLTLQLLNTTYDIMNYNATNRFYGLVNIYFRINSQTNFVVLHAKYLTVHSISVKEVAESNQRPVNVNIVDIIYDNFYDYMILVLDKPLSPGVQCELEIKYSGFMTNDESGIINTIYYDSSKKQKFYIIYSKLEPIGARRLCPCFDEPDKKATFTVKLIHEEQYQALSNMPEVVRQNFSFSNLLYSENHWNRTSSLMMSEFKPTKIPMSIYLLAFVLMENYNSLSANRSVDKLVRVWFPNDLRHTATIPLNYAVQTENFFENYFNFSSPLPKTDHIYIPDFLSGAMENWGLVTYRDRHLLASNDRSVYQTRISLMTIAHELAHFWFGNWLTTKTWGEIWLNEGFASYFASFAYYTQMSLPETTKEELYLYERRQILTKDIKSPTAIIVNVTNPLLFRSVFNSLTYQKGQAVLVWLNSIMGPSGFQRAIQNYIYKFAMKNPTNEEFFDCMDEIGPVKSDLTNIPKLKSFFKPWLYKPGYPIVTVNYDIGKEEVILTQKSSLENSSSSVKWPIHTTFKTSNANHDVSIYFNDTKVFQNPLGRNDFLVVNSNGKSYIRVNYSELLWQRIIDELRTPNSKIDQINKIILLDDAFVFLENNNINISIAKGLVDTYVNETNTIPWLIFYYKIFDKLHEFFKEDVLFVKFSNLVIKLSKKILVKTLRIDSDANLNIIDELNQRVILTMSCEVSNDVVLDWVSQRFLGWIRNPSATRLPKHLYKIILYYGMRINDNKKNWDDLWKMLMKFNNNDPISNGQIAIGLAGTSKPSLLHKLLNHYLNPKFHRSIHDNNQDFTTVIEWIMKSTNGLMVLQRWIVSNSGRIMKYAFGDISRKNQILNFELLLGKICKYIYEPHLVKPLLKLSRKRQILEASIVLNSNWRETTGKKLIQFL